MSYIKCYKCNQIYDNSAFKCMCGNGERSDSSLELYGDTYNLCPKCTSEVYALINKSQTAQLSGIN